MSSSKKYYKNSGNKNKSSSKKNQGNTDSYELYITHIPISTVTFDNLKKLLAKYGSCTFLDGERKSHDKLRGKLPFIRVYYSKPHDAMNAYKNLPNDFNRNGLSGIQIKFVGRASDLARSYWGTVLEEMENRGYRAAGFLPLRIRPVETPNGTKYIPEVLMGCENRPIKKTSRTYHSVLGFLAGKRDPEDPDYVTSALREFYEETGQCLGYKEIMGIVNNTTNTGTGSPLDRNTNVISSSSSSSSSSISNSTAADYDQKLIEIQQLLWMKRIHQKFEIPTYPPISSPFRPSRSNTTPQTNKSTPTSSGRIVNSDTLDDHAITALTKAMAGTSIQDNNGNKGSTPSKFPSSLGLVALSSPNPSSSLSASPFYSPFSTSSPYHIPTPMFTPERENMTSVIKRIIDDKGYTCVWLDNAKMAMFVCHESLLLGTTNPVAASNALSGSSSSSSSTSTHPINELTRTSSSPSSSSSSSSSSLSSPSPVSLSTSSYSDTVENVVELHKQQVAKRPWMKNMYATEWGKEVDMMTSLHWIPLIELVLVIDQMSAYMSQKKAAYRNNNNTTPHRNNNNTPTTTTNDGTTPPPLLSASSQQQQKNDTNSYENHSNVTIDNDEDDNNDEDNEEEEEEENDVPESILRPRSNQHSSSNRNLTTTMVTSSPSPSLSTKQPLEPSSLSSTPSSTVFNKDEIYVKDSEGNVVKMFNFIAESLLYTKLNGLCKEILKTVSNM